MSDTGSINDAPSLLHWLKTEAEQLQQTQLVEESPETMYLKKSEKEKIEELLLAGLPSLFPPKLPTEAFREIILDFSARFGIGRVGKTNGSFDATESAMALAALGAWAPQHMGSGLVQALSSGKGNPLEIALNQFTAESKIGPTEGVSAHLMLRQYHAVLAAIKTVPVDIVEKALLLAQQQLIISILDQWIEANAKLAEQAKEDAKKLDIKLQEISAQIIRDYIRKAENSQAPMTQPAITMLLGALTIDASLLSLVYSVSPALTASATTAVVPIAIQPELAVLATGFFTTALAWAAPLAIELLKATPSEPEMQFAQDTAKAFALATAHLILSDSYTEMLTSRLQEAVASGSLSQDQAIRCASSFNISMLLAAAALLYKSQTGGVTAAELKGVMDGSVTLSQDNFLLVIAKLVKEQLDALPKADRDPLLNELLKAYDENPSLEAIQDPIRIFIALWDPKFFREANLAHPG